MRWLIKTYNKEWKTWISITEWSTVFRQSDSEKDLVVLLCKQTSNNSQGNTGAEPANAVLDVCTGEEYQVETKEFYYYGLLKTSKIITGLPLPTSDVHT